MPNKDPEARKAWQKAYYEKNRERILAQSNAYYHERKSDPEYVASRATSNERWKNGDGRETYLASRKRRYQKNSDAFKADARERMAKRREVELPVLQAIESEAKKGGCSECSEKRGLCLEFNHRNPLEKSFTIGKAIHRLVKPEKLIAEIEKCLLLCKNCHLLHHEEFPSPLRKQPGPTAERGRRYREKRREKWSPYIERCKASGCTLCPTSHPRVLHFHHVDPSIKTFEVMNYVLQRYNVDLPAEVHKCMVLCANCHRCVEAGVETLPKVDLDTYWAERLGYEA